MCSYIMCSKGIARSEKLRKGWPGSVIYNRYTDFQLAWYLNEQKTLNSKAQWLTCYTVSRHIISYTLLVLGWTLFCLQSCLKCSRLRFNKVRETCLTVFAPYRYAFLSAQSGLAILLWPVASTRHFHPDNCCSLDILLAGYVVNNFLDMYAVSHFPKLSITLHINTLLNSGKKSIFSKLWNYFLKHK